MSTDSSNANRPARAIAEMGMKSTLAGIFVNLGLAVTKCAAGFLGNSFALIADGVESATDVVTGLVVYFGLKTAIRPPDEKHPYGYGKAEPIAALVVSLSLVGVALTLGFESIRGILTTPHPRPAPYTLIVLAGVLVVKELLYRHVNSVGNAIGSSAVRSDAWNHRGDAITSAFAFAGISIALLGGKGWEVADRWAALGAAFLILYSASKELRPAIFELGDRTPDPTIEEQVRTIAKRVPGVFGLEKCLVRKMGFTFYVDLHVMVNGDLSVREGHRIAHRVEDEVLRALQHVSEVLVHVEPGEELTSGRAS